MTWSWKRFGDEKPRRNTPVALLRESLKGRLLSEARFGFSAMDGGKPYWSGESFSFPAGPDDLWCEIQWPEAKR